MDIAGNSLCASALLPQLGPLGQQEYVFDTSLKTMDIRTMRFSQDIYCMRAASLRWYFGSTTSSAGMPILGRSTSGTLHTLDSRCHDGAEPVAAVDAAARRAAHLLDIASSSQLLCAGGSGRHSHRRAERCALRAAPGEPVRNGARASGAFRRDTISPRRRAGRQPTIGLQKLENKISLASVLVGICCGKRGQRYVDTETHLNSLNLQPAQHIAFGSVSAWLLSQHHQPAAKSSDAKARAWVGQMAVFVCGRLYE